MGHTVADRSSNEADFLCISCIWRGGLWKSVVTLAVTGLLFPVGIFGVRGCRCFRGIDCRDRKSMGHTVADRSSNEADFSVYFLYLAWRLRKSVVTLAVTGNTISGRSFSASEGAGVSEASTAVDRKSMGHTVADRS
jgi:hypothetical protein